MNSQKINTMVVLSLLFFLFLGIFSFNLYTGQGSDTLTSATVVSMNKEIQPKNQETSAKNKITGMSVSITGAPTVEEVPQTSETNGEKQIGTYSVLPSFSFPEKGNFVLDYDTLQKQIRLFYEAVNDCKISNPSETPENCIQDALAQPEYSNWLSESDCETDEERVFYDLTQDLSDCSQSEDSDCTCQSHIQQT